MRKIGLIGGMTPESTKVYYELPLVISNDDLPVQVLDTTRIHVAAILAAAS